MYELPRHWRDDPDGVSMNDSFVCPECQGYGSSFIPDEHNQSLLSMDCWACRGKGMLSYSLTPKMEKMRLERAMEVAINEIERKA